MEEKPGDADPLPRANVVRHSGWTMRLAKAQVPKEDRLQRELVRLQKRIVDLDARDAEHIRNLSQFLDAIPYGILIVNRDGNPLFANRAAIDMLGPEIFYQFSHKELKQTQLTYYAGTSTEYPRDKIPIARALRGERSSIDDIEVHIGEHIIPLEISANPVYGPDNAVIYAIGIFQDITERKHTRKAIKESEEKYRRLIDNSLIGIYITQNHIVRFCNQRLVEIFGYRGQEELVGQHVKILVAHEDWQLVDKEVRLRESGLKEASRYEFKGIKKDGTLFDIEVLGNRIYYEGKPAIQWILLDITERRRSELERQVLEDQLHQLQKMEAIGTLAGGIAHDFNNILSAIIGYTELAVFDVQGNKDTLHKLGQVLAAAERAREMVKQILAFSRKGEKVQKPILLGEIVKEAIKLLRSTLPTTIDIRSTIGEQLHPVMANPTQLHQVIMNICTNAAYAMRETGGFLQIELREVDLGADAIDNREIDPGHYQQMTFSDNGCGMSPEVKARIFEPYFTTKPQGEGTGMGLAVVHGIVKNHGGTITVQSEPGKGASFDMFFPITRVRDIPHIVQEEDIPGGNERILYVEDELNLAEMGKQTLVMMGYRVDSRTSSIEALEAFKVDPKRYSLVITDQTMPNMTGLRLARELHRIRQDIPIILCTGFSESVNEENFRAHGVDAFVMKPIIRKEIARIIRQVLDKAATIQKT